MIYSAASHTKGESHMDHSHVASLTAKHAGIEQLIEAETRRPRPDMVIVARLKKQKLRLKEELHGFVLQSA
jgi:uncharacterized protein